MSDFVFRIRLFVIGILSLVTMVIWQPLVFAGVSSDNYLTVRFLDVGQGDAIHIITPEGYEVLIDGGPTATVLRELAKGKSFFDKKIDVIIATHPDTDHVGGLVDVMQRYEIDYIFEIDVKSNSPAAQAYYKSAQAEEARLITAVVGQTIQVGASTTIYVLSPAIDTSGWESNTASVIVQVLYGDIAFMLTGDAPSSIENNLVNQFGTALRSNVLKLGHHGSKTSSSGLFLDAVKPKYAVVSAGTNNRYGHPNVDVMERVKARNIEVVSTAEKGTVEFKSDGEKVWLIK